MVLYFICKSSWLFPMQIKMFVLAKGTHLQSEDDLVEGESLNVYLYLNDHFPTSLLSIPIVFVDCQFY